MPDDLPPRPLQQHHHGQGMNTRKLHLFALLLAVGCASTSTELATKLPPAASPTVAPVQLPPAPAALRASDTALLPTGITSFGAAELDGHVYVLGGYHGEPHNYDKTGQSGALIRLDPSTNTWTSLPAIKHLQSVTLVAHDGELVRVGGMRAHNDPGQGADLRSVDEVASFDPTTGSWAPGPALPKPRSSHDAATLDGAMYVVGGWALSGKPGDGEFATDTLVLKDGTWTSIPQPFKRRALAVAAAGGKVYAIGGLDDAGEPSSRVDVLDVATGTWSQGPDVPGFPFGMAAAVDGTRVLVSGMEGVVYALHEGGKSWTPVSHLAFPRFFHRMVDVDGELLALGGIRGMTKEDRVLPVEPVPVRGDRAEVLTWELEAPGLPKNRHAAMLHGDSLFLFGGNKSTGQHDFDAESFQDQGMRLHLTSMRWSKAAAYPVRRQSMVTVELAQGRSLALGGFGHDGEVARTHPEGFVYDASKDAWTGREGALTIARTQFSLVRHGEELYVFGGLDYDPRRDKEDQFRHLLPVLRASATDGSNAFERTGVELPRPRRAFGGAELDGKVYLVGGMREDFQTVSECDVLDLESETWSAIPAPSATRINPTLVSVGGALYLLGGGLLAEGARSPEPARSVERFDPKTQTWSTVLDELPFDPTHAHFRAYGHGILVVSTHDKDVERARVALIRLPVLIGCWYG